LNFTDIEHTESISYTLNTIMNCTLDVTSKINDNT